MLKEMKKFSFQDKLQSMDNDSQDTNEHSLETYRPKNYVDASNHHEK
jgi:hypothetical protein